MDNRTWIPAILALACHSSIASDAVYIGNPSPAYPPGCITTSLSELDLEADNAVRFHSERIWLEVTASIESDDPLANFGQAQLDLYRIGCAEANRSVIIAEFRLPSEHVELRKSRLILPRVAGVTGLDPYPLEFRPEANSPGQPASQLLLTGASFGDYTGGWYDARMFAWRYVLDGYSLIPGQDRDDPPKYYNSEFGLAFLRSDGSHFHTVLVPATKDVLEPAPDMPLSGRLSGNWVEEGSADQGFLISFSTAPPHGAAYPESSDLVVFLSWFTFDARGKLLWLTGAAHFPQGDSEVAFPLELSTGGTFLGDAGWSGNQWAGTVRLRALDCNRLELEYELRDLGFGTDVVQLERLFALEIADYPCRDYEALQSSIYPPEPN